MWYDGAAHTPTFYGKLKIMVYIMWADCSVVFVNLTFSLTGLTHSHISLAEP